MIARNAATTRGLFQSTDGGTSWARVLSEADSFGYQAVLVTPGDPRRILTGTSSGFTWSSDGGATWADSPACSQLQQFLTLAADATGPVYAAGIDPTSPPRDPAHVFVCRTTDGGSSFERLPDPPKGFMVGLAPRSPAGLLAATTSGVFELDASLGWVERTSGILSLSNAFMLVAPSDLNVAYVTIDSTGLGSWTSLATTDGGESWLPLPLPFAPCEPGGWTVHPTSPSNILRSTCSSMSRSTDGGTTWRNLPKGISGARRIRISSVEPSVVLAATRSSVHRSTDGGETWKDVSPLPLTGDLVVEQEPLDPNVIYAANFGFVARSLDRGVSWSVQSAAPTGPFTDLVADPSGPGRLYGVSGSSLVHSSDGGHTWTARSTFEEPPSILAPTASAANEVYAIVRSRLLRSADGGRHFSRSGLDSSNTLSAAVVPGRVWAATGGGVYSIDGSVLWGDLDLDGDVEVGDAILLQASIVGNQLPGATPWLGPWQAGDVNGDEVLDVLDVVLLLARIVGNAPPFS